MKNTDAVKQSNEDYASIGTKKTKSNSMADWK